MFRLNQLCHWLNLPEQSSNPQISGVCLDSRHIKPGQLFVAMSKGYSRSSRTTRTQDTHDYVQKAIEQGASAVLLSKNISVDRPTILVEDTAKALIQCATAYRKTLSIPIAALTGSCGKTTTKDMLANILSLSKHAHATYMNQNNLLGVSLTLLNAPTNAEYIVLEMGANEVNEISESTKISQPDIGIITMAGLCHLQGFNGLDGVAKAKGELFENLAAGKTAIINSDDKYANYWYKIAHHCKIIRFGCQQGAEISATKIHKNKTKGVSFTLNILDQSCQIDLKILGQHQAYNAMAAAAAAHALGLDMQQIKQGLALDLPLTNRLKLKPGILGCQIIDDTYNANPTAFMAAIETIQSMNGQTKSVVMGDMGELGQESQHLHRVVGKFAKESGVNYFYSYGEHSRHASEEFGGNAEHFSSKDVLIAKLKSAVNANTVVLIKGSREMAMEDVVLSLCEEG